MSLPGEAVHEEALCCPPREAWPLARVLSLALMKMGLTGPPCEPRRRLQAGKFGDPCSQNANSGVAVGCPELRQQRAQAGACAVELVVVDTVDGSKSEKGGERQKLTAVTMS